MRIVIESVNKKKNRHLRNFWHFGWDMNSSDLRTYETTRAHLGQAHVATFSSVEGRTVLLT